jgi:hypothetical protein
MYLVDHPAAIKTPLNFYDIVSITICQQFETKMEKQKRTVLKARKKPAVDCSNEIFWSFYLMCISFLNLNNATTAKINFDPTEI